MFVWCGVGGYRMDVMHAGVGSCSLWVKERGGALARQFTADWSLEPIQQSLHCVAQMPDHTHCPHASQQMSSSMCRALS